MKFNLYNLLKILFFIYFNSAHLKAQLDEIHLTHLTSEDGLSLSQVTQIYQDKDGFMWFGTFSGLNRYDGYNFKVFLPEQNNQQSISSHHVTSIFQDSKGILWIGTNHGLNRFDSKTETFHKYMHNPNDKNSISHNLIYSIVEDKSGTLWVGTHNALNKFNRDNNVFEKMTISFEDHLNSSSAFDNIQSISCMVRDYKGNLWIGTWDGLTYMSPEGQVIKQFFSNDKSTQTIKHKLISFIYEDRSRFIWIGTNGGGLEKYDPQTGQFEIYRHKSTDSRTISNDYINVIFEEQQGDIWIGTKNGLNKYDPVNNNFIRIYNDPEKPLSIINNEILSINQDRSGLMWVGSGGGISRFYKPSNKFYYYQENKVNPTLSLSNNRVNSVFVDSKENIWVGTLDGLDKIIDNGNKVLHYKNDAKNKNSISNNFIMSVIEDHLGYLWVGTNQDGLNRINPATGENKIFLHDYYNVQTISNSGITDIYEDHKGTIWVGTWYGLNRYNRKTGNFLRYENDPDDHKSLSNNLIWKIYEDSQKMLWIGTDGGGVCLMDPKINVFKTFMNDSTKINSISNNRVFTIYESKDGIMWFGTFDGLNSYDRKTEKFKTYKKENGLLGTMIFAIEEDKSGSLWISTDKGLSYYNRKAGIFENYTKKDGLKELEFIARASSKSRSGKIFFGCKAGLVSFDPENMVGRSTRAPIVFTDLKIYNQPVPIQPDKNSILTESITSSKEISIPSISDVFTIDFAFLYYSNIRGNTYSYKLSGFENNWNDVGNRNSATYTNLTPGEYIFQVKASNSDGIKSDGVVSLNIKILPAFYETWIFKIALVLGLIITAVLFFRFRTQKIKSQNILLEHRVGERTKDLDKTISELNLEVTERKKAEATVQASLKEKEKMLFEKEVLLKEIHHRVKNNLQVISSLLFLQSQTIKDEEMFNLFEDSRNRIRSMALIHEKLYQSKDFSEINLLEYVTSLLTQLKQSCSSNLTIQEKIFINDNINFNLDTAMSCGLIINELMTNAYKYAFPKEWVSCQTKDYEFIIEVSIHEEVDGKYSIVVKDNGVGIPENFDVENTESLGLKIVTSMVDQLDGTLNISRNNGTQFTISFSCLK